MPHRKLARDQAATAIVKVLADYGVVATEAEAGRVIDLFASFKASYKTTGCKAQPLPGTNGGFTTAVFTGENVPAGTELFIKEKK